MANVSKEQTYNFAIKLAQNVLQHERSSSDDQNLICSPASISAVLAMCLYGSEGNTKSQIKDIVFGSKVTDEDAEKLVHNLLDLVGETNEFFALVFANRLYASDQLNVSESYQQKIKTVFRSVATRVDFAKNARSLAVEISNWVASQTNNRIKDLIAPEVLSPDTSLLLVNALYFKGVWDDEFPEMATKPQDFYVNPTRQIKVDMMHMTERKLYFEDDNVQVIDLAYGLTSSSMLILLPKEKFGIKKLLTGMNGRTLKGYLDGLRKREVQIWIPKFKVEQAFKLNEALIKLGITDAFTVDANFTNMVEPGGPTLRISDVYHKAFIEVDEKGTEAAAATYVKCVPCSLIISHDDPCHFVADHPFLFMITAGPYQNRSILFIGQFCGNF